MKLNKKQHGIALPISLFVLFGVLLAALLLMRSGDVSVTVAGNVGIKVQLSGSNDQAIAYALKWVQDNKVDLKNDNYSNGYFSASPVGYVDYTSNVNWNNAKQLNKDDMGNISYIKIIRLCNIPNAERNQIVGGINNVCMTDGANSVTSDTSSVGYGAFKYTQEAASSPIMYKVLVKTVGPKDATMISESIISI